METNTSWCVHDDHMHVVTKKGYFSCLYGPSIVKGSQPFPTWHPFFGSRNRTEEDILKNELFIQYSPAGLKVKTAAQIWEKEFGYVPDFQSLAKNQLWFDDKWGR